MRGDIRADRLTTLPTPHQLRSALTAGRVVIRHLGRPVAELERAFVRTPTDGVYSANDLSAGEGLLEEARLCHSTDGRVEFAEALAPLLGLDETAASEVLLDRLLEARHPLWVSAVAGTGVLAPELMPDHAERELSEIITDPARREAFLLALGRRFTDEDRRRVGGLAETYVTLACQEELREAGRPDLCPQVSRVSLLSDQLGYDVTAPHDTGNPRRLEVKGTRSQSATVTIHLSRNEADTGLRDPDWYLVLCRVSTDDDVELVGWSPAEHLKSHLPTDPETGGAWQSTEIQIDTAELTAGLPPWRRAP